MRLLIALFLWLALSPAHAAVASLDNGCSPPAACLAATSASGTTVTATISAGATADYVSFSTTNNSAVRVTSITWSGGGGAYSKVLQIAGTNTDLEIWAAVSPGAAAGGTFTLNWTGGNARIAMSHASWTGTVTSSVAAAFLNATSTNGGSLGSPSIAITSSSGDFVAGTFLDDTGLASSITLNQTTNYNSATGSASGSEFTSASAGSTNLTATFGGVPPGTDLVIGFDIAAPAAGGTVPKSTLFGVGP